MRRTWKCSLVIAAMSVGLIGCASSGTQPESGISNHPDLLLLRNATSPFRQLDAAVAAGYAANVKDCLVHEHHGAMGFHHVNASYFDAKLEVDKPEILLYERTANGEYKLNGVEFIVPYRAWPRDSVAPVLMGQHLKHEDNLKFWYLHVWAWSDNADGVFADFNPNVQCSADTRKIFRPSGAA
jgi:hypothetical protein